MTETTHIQVPIEDLYPRPNARKLDTDLVHELTASMLRFGFKPTRPITAVKDGDIYVIIDGGHRHAAANAAGIATVPVEVENIDEPDILVEEGALNIQRPDTPEERWSRMQQFMLLGTAADPDDIRVATGIDAETQAKVRRARKIVSDDTAFEDVSLDLALAITEFEDDPEAVKELVNSGKDWYYTRARLVSARKGAESAEIAVATIGASGCVLVTKYPEGKGRLGQTKDAGPAPEGATHASYEVYGSTAYITWYGEASAEDGDAGERDRIHNLHTEAAEKREAFVVAYINGESSVGLSNALRDLAVTLWNEGVVPHPDDAFEGITSFFGQVYAALLQDGCERWVEYVLDYPDDWYRKEYGEQVAAYLDALVKCGYELTDIEERGLASLRAES